MLETFYLLFSLVFSVTSLIIILLKKWEALSRGIIFSATFSGFLLGIIFLKLLPIPEVIGKTFSSLVIKKEKCRAKSIMKLSSDPEVNKILLLQSALEIEDVLKFLQKLDPILRERILSSLDEFLETMNICDVRKSLKSRFHIEPATFFILKTKDFIEPEIISEWLSRADGFLFENKTLLSPDKLIEMFPKELTGNFEISENRIIIYIKKR